MDQLINHHVHTTGSDGKLSPEETIKLAIEKKLTFICFTDHYPFPPNFKEWGRDFHSEEYYKEIKKTIEKYKDKIEISFGAEFNWVPDYVEWTKKEIKKREYDFILGSVHTIENNNKTINGSENTWKKLIEDYRGIKNLVKEFYYQTRLMADSELFDCVAHFDLIKIQNKNSKYFNENDDWYKKEVLKTLNRIKKTKIAIEINTSGERKSGEDHPSFWILQEMKKRNIPITIGSDSHSPEQIDYRLKEAIQSAKKAGYTSIVKFKNRKAISIPI